MVRLIPREAKFFEMFNDIAKNLVEGAQLLSDIFQDYRNVYEQVQRLKAIEHRGDEMTHAIITHLNRTFITPIDREDIHKLASSIDDVLDFVDSAGQSLVTYKIPNAPAAALDLAMIILRQAEALAQAVSALGSDQDILGSCVEINRLENEADQVKRQAIGMLFENEKDAITVMKYKELYEMLERATDKAEDASNVLESVRVKSA
jgi:predicted phosphate transport protein (TIGR00153 family)